MIEYTQSSDGYIVFDDGGITPIAYGAAENGFPLMTRQWGMLWVL